MLRSLAVCGEEDSNVEATPIDTPFVEVASEKHIFDFARGAEYRYSGFHVRSTFGSFWKEVGKYMKYINKWETNTDVGQSDRVSRAMNKGQSPLLEGNDLHDKTWIPSGPFDLGRSVDTMMA